MNRSGTSNSSFSDRPVPDSKVDECVRYIISREGSKLPIKQCDIKKHLEDNSIETFNIKTVIERAKSVLNHVYGYTLVQLDAKPTQFIVTLKEPDNYSMLSTYNNPEHRKLLIAALTHIFMTGASVKDDDMWQFLILANLMKESDHEKKKLLTKTFTGQMYLKQTKEPNGALYFNWGQRAEKEIPKEFLLNKMSEAFNVSAEYWIE